MVDLNCLELVDKHLVTNHIGLHVGYSKDVIKASGGSRKLNEFTQSSAKLMEYFIELYKQTTNKEYPIRRIGISFGNVVDEHYKTFDLFTDFEKEEKEHKIQQTILEIKKKFGKNALLKAMNLQPKATTKKRNQTIGGHNSGEDV